MDRIDVIVVRHGHDAAHARALACRDSGGGRLLEHFLVTALERAVALAQMDRIALSVAEDLELDMARIAQVFFEIDRCVAECGLRFGARLLHKHFELVFGRADLHPAPAAARGGLNDDGIA